MVSQVVHSCLEFTRSSFLVRLLGWARDRCLESFLVKFPFKFQAKYQVRSRDRSRDRSQARSQARYRVRSLVNTHSRIQYTCLCSLLQVGFCR